MPAITYRTGIDSLDHLLKPHLGALMTITGIPGHGKSTFVLHLVAQMARRHGWRAAIASFEMRPRRIRDALVAAYGNHVAGVASIEERRIAEAWAERDVVLIDPGKWDVDVTIDWFCNRVVEAVARHGVRIVVADPWNEFDHPRYKGSISTDYVGDALKKLRRVAEELDVLMIIVAHPTKMDE